MRIDLSCPVELWHFRMPTADYPVVSLQLFNLTDKPLNSIQAAFLCYDQEGERLSRQVERIPGLEGAARSAFEMDVAIEDGERAARMDFIIERVWFEDGTVWRRTAGEMAEYEDNRLPKGKQLDALRHVAGEDARGYPSDQGAVWVCVCGRPNPASRASCARCERDKQQVFRQYSKAFVEKYIFERDSALEEKARQAREEAGRMQMQREEAEQKVRRRRKRIWASVLTLLLLVGAAYGGYFHGWPAFQYYRAGEFLKRGDYQQAKEIYLSMPEYGESARLAKESDYLRAKGMVQTGTLTSFKAAEVLFEELQDYQDAPQLRQQMIYEQAELRRKAGEFEQAIALYGRIEGYPGAAGQATLSEYEWARQLMEGLNYAAAREKFLALGDYEDARALSEQCLYAPAVGHLERGEYEQAEALFLQMADQDAVALKLQETYYRWGDELFSQEAYEQAAEMYLKAGDYLDSSRKAANCLYEPARQAMDRGEYEKAREAFLKIPNFQDAARLAERCAWHLGMQKMQAGEYEAAIPLLEAAPSVEGALASAREAAFLQARVLEGKGELEAAAEMFTRAGEHADARAQATRLHYALGIQAANERDYPTAIRLFGQLGDYENSREELSRARYNQAISFIEAGRVDEAITELTALQGYARSEGYLQQAYYLKGKQLLEQEEYEQAAEALKLAGNYQDADELYKDSLYRVATALLAQQDAARATPLLKAIEGYKDATELLQQTAYQLASAMKEAGQYREAAEQFRLIAGYQDAAQQAESCYDLYYAEAYATAATAIKQKDFKHAIDALEPLDRENPGEKYKQIGAMYTDAVYQYANQLYDEGEPYLALPYYRQIQDYRDVKSKLSRVSYRILGSWRTEKGYTMVFNEDGTCLIDGRKYYFHAKNYLLQMGDRKEDMNIRFNILHSTDKALNLRREKPNTVYKMTRTPAT